MKVKVEVECTPVEARTFLGLPDLSPVNEAMVEEMGRRMEANMAALKPEELLRTWTAFGGQAQEQFRRLMGAAADAALKGTTTRS